MLMHLMCLSVLCALLTFESLNLATSFCALHPENVYVKVMGQGQGHRRMVVDDSKAILLYVFQQFKLQTFVLLSQRTVTRFSSRTSSEWKRLKDYDIDQRFVT